MKPTNDQRRGVLLLCALLALVSGCQLTHYFEPPPPERCDVVGAMERIPCGPCLVGEQARVCGENGLWRDEGRCDNRYDLDGDGYANADCFVDDQRRNCCGELDCDDSEARRYPGALADLDGDDRYDARCCDPSVNPRCSDCDDDNDDLWNGHADRDGDDHDDVACGGDDCDDQNAERWNGHADADGDGHTDQRCCADDMPLCDDCNDDDPLRWTGHADLDGDGHIDVGCGGDDCDDMHPLRWIGNADVDGDGHQDDRCCPEGDDRCDDCNDNDPRRWTGNTDLDDDGYHDLRCRCDPERSPIDCNFHTDCDDDCPSCHPSGSPSGGEGLDHDCSGVNDELEEQGCVPQGLSLLTTVDTGSTLSVYVTGHVAFVGSVDGLYAVDVADPEQPRVMSSLDIGAVQGIAMWGGYVLVATTSGLVVVVWDESALLARLVGPIDTGDSRAVFLWEGRAIVASYAGLSIVDISDISNPVVIARVNDAALRDARDVIVSSGRAFVVSHVSTPETEGGLSVVDLSDPAVPVLTWTLHIRGATAIRESCETIYVATTEGVGVVRSTDTPHFEMFGYDLYGLEGIFPQCDALFVAGDTGLVAIDFGERRTQSVTIGMSRDVFVANQMAYVATIDGLHIVGIMCRG